MKKATALVRFLAFLAGFCHPDAVAQAGIYPQWGDLTPGPYHVGFQVFNHYDRGRYVKPRVDFEGKPVAGERALPVQVSLWYPAEVGSQQPMRFEEYLYLTRQKNTFQPLTEREKTTVADGLRFLAQLGAGIDVSDADLQSIRATPTAAYREAKPAKGRFPVIISGLDGGPGSANILYEYLASHGYVVLSTPSIDRTGTFQATRPGEALTERIGNLEFLLSFAHTRSFADPERLGVLGINFDGMAALLFQMKNMQADAVASLDGWEGKNAGSQTLRVATFFDANQMRVPYLVVQQDDKAPDQSLQLNPAVFNAFRYAGRFHYVLNEMGHAFLVGNLGVLPQLPPEKRTAYRFLHTTLRHFFDAYLKKLPAGLEFLKKSAVENGFPAAIVKEEIKQAALPPVPTASEFEALVMAGQTEKATRIFQEGKTLNPGLVLFNEHTLNLFAFRFGQMKQPQQVLAIRRMGVLAFPQSVRTQEALGDAYQRLNDPLQARSAFEKALALVENDATLEASQKNQFREKLRRQLESLKTN